MVAAVLQHGSSALMLACRNGCVEAAGELISAGTKLDLQNEVRDTGMTACTGVLVVLLCVCSAGVVLASRVDRSLLFGLV